MVPVCLYSADRACNTLRTPNGKPSVSPPSGVSCAYTGRYRAVHTFHTTTATPNQGSIREKALPFSVRLRLCLCIEICLLRHHFALTLCLLKLNEVKTVLSNYRTHFCVVGPVIPSSQLHLSIYEYTLLDFRFRTSFMQSNNPSMLNPHTIHAHKYIKSIGHMEQANIRQGDGTCESRYHTQYLHEKIHIEQDKQNNKNRTSKFITQRFSLSAHRLVWLSGASAFRSVALSRALSLFFHFEHVALFNGMRCTL